MMTNKGMLVQPNEDRQRKVISGIVGGLRAVSDQSGKHRSIDRLAKMTDLEGTDLNQAVNRLSNTERRDMLKAFAELDRVVGAVAKKK